MALERELTHYKAQYREKELARTREQGHEETGTRRETHETRTHEKRGQKHNTEQNREQREKRRNDTEIP